MRPEEHDFELVETSRGKRWCRDLTLNIDVLVPENMLSLIEIFEDHNAKVGNVEAIVIPRPLPASRKPRRMRTPPTSSSFGMPSHCNLETVNDQGCLKPT